MLTRNATPADLAFWLHAALWGDAEANRAETDERLGDGPWRHHLDGLVVHDRREEIRGSKHARGKPGPPRPWSKIYGMAVHQSAVGVLHADHPRLLSIPAHLILHQDGSLSKLHPLVLRLYHAHSLNGFTIGLEIDCREYGMAGDRRTFWRSKQEIKAGKTVEELHRPVTQAQIDALPKVLDYCHGAFWHNAPIAHRIHFGIWMHRQGHHSRTSDPGQRIAQACDRHTIRRLWKDVSNEKYGSGTPWPKEWKAR